MTSTPRRYAAAARRRLARLAPDRVRRSTAPEAPPPVVGLVEQFSRRLAVGWVSVPKDHPPVKVTLHLGPVQVASTYATPGSAMSGSNSVLRGNAPKGKGKGKGDDKSGSATGELVHKWQAPNIESPSDDRRNSGGEIRTFSFRLRGIWPYARKRNRVTIRVDDRPLPIYGHGTYLVPPRNGKHTPADLRKKFDEGYLLGQTGKLQLSKKLDEDWQRRVMHLYDVVRRLVDEEFGYDVFFIYGTLLGAIREGGHIGHDVDMDVAFVSKHTHGPDAASELQQIGLKMVERGLDVRCMASALHISEPVRPRHEDRPVPHVLRRERTALLPVRLRRDHRGEARGLAGHQGDRLPRRARTGPGERRAGRVAVVRFGLAQPETRLQLEP